MSPDSRGNEHHEEGYRRDASEKDGIRPQGARQFQQLADPKKESGHRQEHPGGRYAVDARRGPCDEQDDA
jgi:hypothetical protein